MKTKIKQEEIAIPSMESECMNQTETTFTTTCSFMKEFFKEETEHEEKKEILSSLEEMTEDMMHSLTQLHVYLKDYSLIINSFITKREIQRSGIAKKLIAINEKKPSSAFNSEIKS